MIIDRPGIFKDFPTAAYFGDPTPTPSLTQSLAKVLIEQSPLHAFQQHPRLNVKPADEDDGEKYDKARAIGNAAHKLMLDRGKDMSVGEFEDWRTGAAKAFKLASLQEGKEPILRKHFDAAGAMVDAALEQLSRIPGTQNAFTHGDAEVVIANCENGIWLRSMIDWITPDLREVWDYKTGGVSASPYATPRRMADAGWHIQAAFHERILDAIDPKGAGRRKFFYVAQENEGPFALTVNQIGEAALTIGRKQVSYAINTWTHCLRRNTWPAYPNRINTAELPTWAESQWLGREMDEASENDPDLIFAG
ncbi:MULTISPECIES: PD-(D/E)XK nuclease-like domain-containing protein [unclassified Bradyrhizobium]|uniref:PD-(D/E)XK nuclease-like domain-containing protein n=1 Tax=unclassified Bradyrhizobium TaxID=2631580 RepID=UPI00247A477F|nr:MULTISPECIES: PD-(D/E)XK nuclease-like domain-containing protein [unclassified Bradyrhizobium]WGR74309.1 PD-(D/E)XK nuclease-like domain-containing protein [Bradyrhizobium sp. ISRA426]WGR79144.1 PD-(D/E)XK nuclease-like domain-containing protein [Bradyrhizobium sp. ISRA430]WGR90632.1 PD-(D/E)XK nuclease-like domain-containing protein [Bradyrhizobium sp. ISRA432]